MIELTEHDRKWIAAVRTVEWALAHQREDHAEAIYRAGLAAGIERGLEHLIDSGFIGSRYAVDARAAIRALVTAERDIPLSPLAPR